MKFSIFTLLNYNIQVKVNRKAIGQKVLKGIIIITVFPMISACSQISAAPLNAVLINIFYHILLVVNQNKSVQSKKQ